MTSRKPVTSRDPAAPLLPAFGALSRVFGAGVVALGLIAVQTPSIASGASVATEAGDAQPEGAPTRASIEDFDFLNPAGSKNPEELLEVRGETVSTPADDLLGPGQRMVSGPSVQDAINRALRDLREQSSAEPLQPLTPIEREAPVAPRLMSGDIRWIETPGGLGVVGFARVRNAYADADNRNLQLWGRRQAAVAAMTEAKLQIVRALNATPVSGRMRLVNETRSNDGVPALSTGVSEVTLNENLQGVVSAFLRGAVVYHSEVSPDGAEVSVWVASTPTSQGRVQIADGGQAVIARTLRDGLDSVIAEAQSQVIPPVGGRLIVDASTGQVAWVGFGAAPLPRFSNPRLQQQMEESARKEAELRANLSLVALINGERLEATTNVEVDFRATSVEYAGMVDRTIEMGGLDRAVQSVRRTSTISQTIEGVVPRGTRTLAYTSGDGDWAWAISICVDQTLVAPETLTQQLQQSTVTSEARARRPAGGTD